MTFPSIITATNPVASELGVDWSDILFSYCALNGPTCDAWDVPPGTKIIPTPEPLVPVFVEETVAFDVVAAVSL
jgi:hypothetical protein